MWLQWCLQETATRSEIEVRLGGQANCLLELTESWMVPDTRQNIDRPYFEHYNFAPRAKEGLLLAESPLVVTRGG